MTKGDNGTTIRATVGVNGLVGKYKAAAKFMNIGPAFGVNILTESVGITFEVEKVKVIGFSVRPLASALKWKRYNYKWLCLFARPSPFKWSWQKKVLDSCH